MHNEAQGLRCAPVGEHWVNAFATVLFNVCSGVKVEFCTRIAWMCLLLYKEEGSSQITDRMDMPV